MTPLLVYLAKVVICSGILYAYYHAMLRNSRFHQWNRYYLLLSTVLSLIVPLLRIPMPFTQTDTQTIYVYTSQVVTLREQVFTPSPLSVMARINWSTLLYCLVLAALLLRLTGGYLKIYALIRGSRVEFLKPYWLVLSEKVGSPFSFFRYIFWNNNLNAESTEGRQILRHEMVHVQEKHSWDKLFMEVVTALCWINPFFHLLKRELSLVHEFIADRKAVANGDVAEYAQSILQMALQSRHSFGVTNNFSHQPIKRRILMLTKSNKLRFSYLRRVLILPLAVLIFCSLAFVVKEEHTAKVPPATAEGQAQPQTKAVQYTPVQLPATAAPSNRKETPLKKDTSTPRKNEVVVVGKMPAPPPPAAPAATVTAYSPDGGNTGPQEEIFTFVEQPPSFPGGEEALAKYLSRNIRYPQAALEKGKSGTVFVSFVVTSSGAVSKVRTVGTPKGDGLEEEAIRVVEAMPGWVPGKQNGRQVAVQFNLPIRFTLQTEAPPGPKVGANGVYNRAEEMPAFPGGSAAMSQYLSNNLRYPEKARLAKIQGTVLVSFVVAPDGSMENVGITNKSLGGGLEEEAMRVVQRMPKWKPAKDDGKNVPVAVRLPIAFRLQ